MSVIVSILVNGIVVLLAIILSCFIFNLYSSICFLRLKLKTVIASLNIKSIYCDFVALLKIYSSLYLFTFLSSVPLFLQT